MKVLSTEKFKALAEKKGWPLARAQGFIDGETWRRRGNLPSQYALVGIDEYCLGFRAGYFERDNPGSSGRAEPQEGSVTSFPLGQRTGG